MSAQSITPQMAQPRVAAGALFFDDRARVLLVKPTYKEQWEVPGGYVESGESPYEASVREVKEELGIQPPIGRLLVVDWAPNEVEGDKVLFLFDGGRLDVQEAESITLPPDELSAFKFVDPDELERHLIARLYRRTIAAYAARRDGATHYMNHGEVTPMPVTQQTGVS